jgi:uncharacterized protein (DUF58 family)
MTMPVSTPRSFTLLPQPQDGSTPLVLPLKRIYILPSRFGLMYGVALVLMLIGAINYTLALGHALVFLLVGLGLAGMVHTVRNLLGLHMQAGQAEPVFAGETALFPLHLSSQVLRPALEWQAVTQCWAWPWTRAKIPARVTADSDKTDYTPPAVRLDIPANSGVTVQLPYPVRRRGWVSLPTVRLRSSYPLGIFTAWSLWHPEARVLVYPEPLHLPLPPEQPDDNSWQGEGVGQEGQEDFFGLRPHHPADSPRHVAWKAVARAPHAPLQVKQFAGGATLHCWLDWNQLPRDYDREDRLSALAGWVMTAEAEGVSYGLRVPGQEIPPGSGSGHQRRCLEVLALYPGAEEGADDELV